MTAPKTPLDNLKMILSEADAAAVQGPASQEEKEKIIGVEAAGEYVEKAELRMAFEKVMAIAQDMIFVDQLEPILHPLYKKI